MPCGFACVQAIVGGLAYTQGARCLARLCAKDGKGRPFGGFERLGIGPIDACHGYGTAARNGKLDRIFLRYGGG